MHMHRHAGTATRPVVKSGVRSMMRISAFAICCFFATHAGLQASQTPGGESSDTVDVIYRVDDEAEYYLPPTEPKDKTAANSQLNREIEASPLRRYATANSSEVPAPARVDLYFTVNITIDAKSIDMLGKYYLSSTASDRFDAKSFPQLSRNNFVVEFSRERLDTPARKLRWRPVRIIAEDFPTASIPKQPRPGKPTTDTPKLNNPEQSVKLFVSRKEINSFYDDYFHTGGMVRVALVLYAKDGTPVRIPARCKLKPADTVQKIYEPAWITVTGIKPTQAVLIPDLALGKQAPKQPVVQGSFSLSGPLPLVEQLLPQHIKDALNTQGWTLVGNITYSSQPLDPAGQFQFGFSHDSATGFKASSYHLQLDDTISESGGNNFSTARFNVRFPFGKVPSKPNTIDKLLATDVETGVLVTYPSSLDKRLTGDAITGKTGIADFGLNTLQ